MSQRRMFSLQVTDTDAFLCMPASAQNLYFHLGLRADDDGFVASPKKIAAMCNASEDDMKILIARRFILAFESGVVVIKHWRMHNLLRSDRYTETAYKDEKSRLALKENGSYTEIENQNGFDVIGIKEIKKPLWIQNRKNAREESNLPYSFDYKIRQAFWGKPCPICKIEMKEQLVEDMGYNSKPNPCPTIQHNIPISKGGKHELGNISVICHSCNVSVRDKETGELNAQEVIEVWGSIGNQSARRLGKVRLGNSDSEEPKAPTPTKKFVPPTQDEVKAYCEQRTKEGRPPVDPVKWFNHYEANGWMVGKNKMKKWKNAVHTWENNNYDKGTIVVDTLKEERRKQYEEEHFKKYGAYPLR